MVLSAACDLSQDAIPATKYRSGRPPKTTKHTDDVRRQEVCRYPHFGALKLKDI